MALRTITEHVDGLTACPLQRGRMELHVGNSFLKSTVGSGRMRPRFTGFCTLGRCGVRAPRPGKSADGQGR